LNNILWYSYSKSENSESLNPNHHEQIYPKFVKHSVLFSTFLCYDSFLCSDSNIKMFWHPFLWVSLAFTSLVQFFHLIHIIKHRPNSHETFLHTILQYCAKKIFWYQSIEFYWTTKLSSEQKQHEVCCVFTIAYIGCHWNPWLKNIFLSQYLFIVILCLVWIRP
jgi:hypothetical protein